MPVGRLVRSRSVPDAAFVSRSVLFSPPPPHPLSDVCCRGECRFSDTRGEPDASEGRREQEAASALSALQQDEWEAHPSAWQEDQCQRRRRR